MLIEDFRDRCPVIPFTTFSRDYQKYTRTADYEGLSHMHKEMEVLLVLGGEAQVYIGATAYCLQEGDVVVLAPYTLHRYAFSHDRDFRHVCLCFDMDLLYDTPLKVAVESRKTVVTPLIRGNARCAAHIESAFAAHAEQAAGWEQTVIGHLSLLLGVLAEDGCLTNDPQPPSPSVYESIFRFVAEHFTEPITSADLAAHLGFHNSYVCRLFRKSFGECFQQYLCRYRLERSKALLKNTALPISEVAFRVGFNDFSYYSKKFREYTALTPTAYRAGQQ